MNTETGLDRFLRAQEQQYDIALGEIRKERKESHWIWFIFPQISGLGFSDTTAFYAIRNMEEAAEYLENPVLGNRLIEMTKVLLAIDGKTANQILGSPDDLKVRSCMTLFSLVPNSDPVFQAVLDKFFDGRPDPKTLAILGK